MKRWILFKAAKFVAWLSSKPKACELTGKLVLTLVAVGLKKKGERS